MRAVMRAPMQAGHYRALLGMIRTYPDLFDSARRYLTGTGEYPHRCRVRTPIGVITPTLFSSHDMSTVNEIFCREDYRASSDVRVVVDVGSNIGVSALYFLTRNPGSRVFLFEPDPKNVARLRLNLADFSGRYEVEEAAVTAADGTATFASEPSGRYGTLLVDEPSPFETTEITVRTRALNGVLADVLGEAQRIDVLKIDTEGSETELVESIDPELLERISTIYYETTAPTPLHTDRFSFHYSCQTNRLTADRV
jgi:FkbM family methyltransferase